MGEMEDLIIIGYQSDILLEFNKYIKENGIDILAVYSIHGNTTVRLLDVSLINNVQFNFSEFIDFDINKNCAIYNVLLNKKAIYNTGEIPFMVKEMNSEIYVPMIIQNKVYGCIYLASSKKEKLDVDIKVLSKIITDNLNEITKLSYKKISIKKLIEIMIFIHEIYSEKISDMIRHAYNVASWSIQIAKILNYRDDQLTWIYLAALMHDIGKIFIDNSILNKRGKLNEEEFKEIEKHVQIGYNIAKRLFMFDYESQIPLWIKQHHEKWNGTGYPDGLKGEEILKEARIIKVADSLDAMITERNYKEKMNLNEAIAELRNSKGKDFDPEVVDAAIAILNERISFSNKLMDDIFAPANIIFENKDGNNVLDGFVSRIGKETLFELKKPLEYIQESDLTSATLIIEKFNVVYEYKAKVKLVDSNSILLYDIAPKELEKSFGLLWLLKGSLISPKSKKTKDITITKISGDDLIFNFSEEFELEDDGVLIIVVQFEDGTKLPLTGKVYQKIKINKVTHYKFNFTGVNEKYRDEVFRQIFRKQISLKKLLNE